MIEQRLRHRSGKVKNLSKNRAQESGMNRQFASTQHLFNSRGYEALDTQDDG